MNQIFQFFQESNGQNSMMRLASFMVVATFCIDWLNTSIFLHQRFEPTTMIVGTVVGVLTAKAAQKRMERPIPEVPQRPFPEITKTNQ